MHAAVKQHASSTLTIIKQPPNSYHTTRKEPPNSHHTACNSIQTAFNSKPYIITPTTAACNVMLTYACNVKLRNATDATTAPGPPT
eukprot:471696-Lingulodinium_polyedra.AAC.1